jgi:hypothetical protein
MTPMRFNPFAERATLQVQTDCPHYLPGETVRVRVRVETEDDLAVEEGRVELIATNRYTYRDRDRDRDGDRTSRQVTTSEDEVAAVARFLEAGTIAPGATEHEAALPLPAAAPPTGTGEIAAVAWKVRAALGVPRANDPDAETPIAVLAPAAAHADRAARPAEESDPLAFALAFELPPRSVRAGQAIAGTLRLEPREEIELREVRVELVRREEVARGDGNTAETVVETARVEGEARLAGGEARSYPFAVTVTADACPCLQTRRTRVRWLLRAVLNRPLRSDYTAAVDLNVFNAD